MNLTATIQISGPLLQGKGPAIVQQHMERFIDEATMLLEREVKVRTPQGVAGAGGLLGSIQGEVQGRGTPLLRGVVGSEHEYVEYVERGRRPGKMPPGGRGTPLDKRPLLPWVQLKFGVTGKEADRLEYLVRRKIGRVGTPGHAMFFKALWENQRNLQAMAQRHSLALSVELNNG